MNCIHLKIKLNRTLFCKKENKLITLRDCNLCRLKKYDVVEYKKIKQVSKKRTFVSKKTYDIVLEKSKGKCALCDCYDNLQYHHILYRSERRDLIDDPTNGIMLCHKEFSKNKCHKKVHDNKKKYQEFLIKKAGKNYGKTK